MRYEAVARKRLMKSNRQHPHHQPKSNDEMLVRLSLKTPRTELRLRHLGIREGPGSGGLT
jgi:hypothetical protein